MGQSLSTGQFSRLNSPLYYKLSALLFLQFFIWGAWYLSVSLYMYEFGMGAERFWAYTAGPLGAIIAPFITGLIADRFFNTERVLGVLFLLAGFFMLCLPWIGGMEGTATAWQEADGGKIAVAHDIALWGKTWDKGSLFNYCILAHMLCYMPTLGLTASLAFSHLEKGDEDFPLVRLWGTLGWIAAGFLLSLGFKGEKLPIQFYLGGGAAIVAGLFAFFLPRTPAPQKGKAVDVGALFFKDAWSQFSKPSFAVFMICSFLICIPLAAYYVNLQQQMNAMEMKYIAAWKNTGTFLEAGMMFIMPWCFRRLGIKWMIVMGVGAWVLRYALFALGASQGQVALIIGGIALHGICYDFFFVTGQVYVEKATSKDVRGQVQSMNIFFTQGIGLYFGTQIAAKIASNAFGDVASLSPESLSLWPKFWWPLAGLAAGILVLFILLFKDDGSKKEEKIDESNFQMEPAQDY